jgi:hypothetical protein
VGSTSISNFSFVSQAGSITENERLTNAIALFTKKLEQEKRKLLILDEQYPHVNKVLGESRRRLQNRKNKVRNRTPSTKLDQTRIKKLENELQHE